MFISSGIESNKYDKTVSLIKEQLKKLFKFNRIIIKFGRYIPNDKPRHDEVLGITLASSNQFAQDISEIKKQLED